MERGKHTNTLQHTAHQHTATHCTPAKRMEGVEEENQEVDEMQHTATTHCNNTLQQHTATTHCNNLRQIATYSNTPLQLTATYCTGLEEKGPEGHVR